MSDNSNSMTVEVYQRKRWNMTMQKSIRQCSTAAQQYIRAQTLRNRQVIDEHNAMQLRMRRTDTSVMCEV